jgi:hypothetical protein
MDFRVAFGRRIVGSGPAAFLLRRMLTRAGGQANRRMVDALIEKEHPNQKHAYCHPSVRIQCHMVFHLHSRVRGQTGAKVVWRKKASEQQGCCSGYSTGRFFHLDASHCNNVD